MKTAQLLLAAALLAGTALAQQGAPRADMSPKTPPTDAIKAYLKLTDQQATDLQALRTSLREAVRPLARQLADKTKTLREELKKDPVNATAVSTLRAEINDLKVQISAKRDEYGAKSRKVLSGEQLAALDALQQALSLLPAARQAIGLNLIDIPEGLAGMLGGGRRAAGAVPGIGAGPTAGPASGRRPRI